MPSGIYTITNKANGKHYVGSSIDVEKRLGEHKRMLKGGYHPNSHLISSFKEHGEDLFEFALLEECEEILLYSQENYWCNILDTYNRKHGYNVEIVLPGGSRRIAEETKRKLSDIKKEQYKDPTKNPFFGKKHTEETKAKMSASGKGKKKPGWTEERRIRTLEARAKTYKTKINDTLGHNQLPYKEE